MVLFSVSSSKALVASLGGSKTFSLESTFLNCFHMSAPGIKVTGKLEMGFILTQAEFLMLYFHVLYLQH